MCNKRRIRAIRAVNLCTGERMYQLPIADGDTRCARIRFGDQLRLFTVDAVTARRVRPFANRLTDDLSIEIERPEAAFLTSERAASQCDNRTGQNLRSGQHERDVSRYRPLPRPVWLTDWQLPKANEPSLKCPEVNRDGRVCETWQQPLLERPRNLNSQVLVGLNGSNKEIPVSEEVAEPIS